MANWLSRVQRAPATSKVALTIVLANLLAAVFAPVLAPFGETEIIGRPWAPGFWGPEHQTVSGALLGTDHLGRDMLSRLLYGARNTIGIVILTTILSFLIGLTGGVLAAAIKGWFDQILSRLVDIVMAFPTLIFALLILSVFGSSVPILIISIAVLESARVYRVARSLAMDVDSFEYVEVARLRGEGLWWITRHEIIPNAFEPLAAEFGVRFCFVFLFISALSFLGLGVQPPTAEWATIVRENASAVSFGMITPILPAAAIALLTTSTNLAVDGLFKQDTQANAP